MSDDRDPRSVIVVEETYNYEIEIGSYTSVTCVSTSGQLEITIPYDGRAISTPAAEGQLTLGTLRLEVPARTLALGTYEVQLPLEGSLPELLRSGRTGWWRQSYTPPVPRDTLLAMEGAVLDGAALDPAMDDGQLSELLFGNLDTFVSDLRLQLNLWVPRPRALVLTGARGRELRRLLLEQESEVQIFAPAAASATQLAESLAALANGAGGRLLVGVKPGGEIVGVEDDNTRLGLRLLDAALRCNPPVVFGPPELLESEDGQKVGRVAVPPSQTAPHLVDGRLLKRRQAETVQDASPAGSVKAQAQQPLGDLRGLLAGGTAADIVMLGGAEGAVTADDLGRAICALVNSEAGQGLIVIRLLPSARGWRASLSRQSVDQGFEQRLNEALKDLRPQIFSPRPEFATIDGERIVVLRVRGHHPTVATHKSEAYEWTGTALRRIDQSELYRRYMLRSGQQLREGADSNPITLLYGDLGWPLHPPGALKLAAERQDQALDQTFAVFDDQVRAVVWRDRRFVDRRGTNGAVCTLTTRLRHAFTEVGGGADSNPNNELVGMLQIRLENVLASGLECVAEAEHPLLRGAPIYKRTQIIAHVKILATELFERRRRASLLHFQVPDIGLGLEPRERIVDLQQACADLGFWVDRPAFLPSSSDNDQRVLIRGVRSTNHHDIQLTLGLRYSTTDVARELRFEQRIDSKQIKTGHLDARVVLSGIGEGAGKEMARLQLGLGQLIHERLHYLRTE